MRTSIPWATLWLLSACAAGRYDHGVYRDGSVAFATPDLGSGWHPVSLSGGDVVLENDGGGSILANGSCAGNKDVPLDVLINHALFGVLDQRELDRETLTMDGRSALRVRLEGTVDGVPVDLDLVVLKKDGCVYDLQLVAGSAVFAARDQDFARFMTGFQVLTGSGS